MRISDWSSYVCSSDLLVAGRKDMWLVLQAVARGNFDQFDLRHLGYSIGALRVTVGPTASPRPAGPTRIRRPAARDKIGRASCRERVCQYVLISVVSVSSKK